MDAPSRWMTAQLQSQIRLTTEAGNHHLSELASMMYAPTAIQKAYALTTGIKTKTLTIEAITIIRESANQA